MKKTLRLIALLLALVLAFGGMLNVQAAPPAQKTDIESALPEALKLAATDRVRKGLAEGDITMWDFYYFPYANTNDATVVKGQSTDLKFYCNYTLPNSEGFIYVVAIFRGSNEAFVEQVEQGREPELVDTLMLPYMECNSGRGGTFSFTWTADSNHPVGDYTMICYMFDAFREDFVTDYDIYMGELHVVSEPKPATDITLWLLRSDGWYEIPENGVIESGWLLPQLSPVPTTDRTSFSVSTNSEYLSHSTALEMSCGYISVDGLIGFARITVTGGGKTRNFWVKGVPYDETEELYIEQQKTSMCVGMGDWLRIKSHHGYSTDNLNPVWEVSDPSVAAIDQKTGIVTGLRAGTVKITATVANFTQTVEYTITDHVFPEGTPVSKRTATQPAQSIGHCTVCDQYNCVTVYEEPIFTDTAPNAWYAPNVDFVYENEIMNGMTENTFAPNKPMTRAMVATVLYRVAGSPESEGEIPFSDVAEGSWYADAVRWAAEKGIVNGYDDGTFLPNRNITREQFATILYRYSESAGVDVSEGADLSAFPDAGSVSSYAVDAMHWAVGTGLITGVASGEQTALRPRDNATRAQFATIVARYMAMTDEAPQEEQPVR